MNHDFICDQVSAKLNRTTFFIMSWDGRDAARLFGKTHVEIASFIKGAKPAKNIKLVTWKWGKYYKTLFYRKFL